MKTTDQSAIADEHLDLAWRTVRARGGGTANPAPEIVSAFMRSLALVELCGEIQTLVGRVDNLIIAVDRIGQDIGSAAELIANAAGD